MSFLNRKKGVIIVDTVYALDGEPCPGERTFQATAETTTYGRPFFIHRGLPLQKTIRRKSRVVSPFGVP